MEFDVNTGSIVFRKGSSVLQNVEMYNLGHLETGRSAVRFESALKGYSSLVNCSIYDGESQGIKIIQSANIYLEGNIIWDFKLLAITISKATNVTLKNNTAGYV